MLTPFVRNRASNARRILWLATLCCMAVASSLAQAAVTPEQRKKIKELDDRTKEAGQMYAEGQYSDSAESIIKVQEELLKLLQEKDRELLRLAKPIYSRLDRAHGLLELEGAEMPVLPSWTELMTDESKSSMEAGQPMEQGVSFKSDVAPWLISSCGGCHVTARKGQFSMVNFDALMQGVRGAKVLYAGDSKGSRLVELIETGAMPPGNRKVEPAKLAALKKWIDEGAKFDGTDPAARMASYAVDESAGAAAASTPMAMSDGSESVSFAKQIAPILVENCKGCHIGGRRASGNLRMDSFTQMMRGGASGELVAGTNVNNSLLIKKLKGQEGQRMPAGRPPLSDEKIALISTWIREGAKFDGPAPNSNINVVIDQAWAEGANHEELFAKRQSSTLANWARVQPNDEPVTAKSNEVFVVGNTTQGRVDGVLSQIDESIEAVRKQLRAPTKEPLVRGGFSVYVLKSRYDYSEFGRMIENRELPKGWLGHWQADPVQVYAVVAAETADEGEQSKAVAMHVVAGAYLGSFQGVPEWFAEGVARNLVMASFRRGDERVKQWQAALPGALQKVENAGMLLNDRLDEEAAGLVGAAITSPLLERSNRRRFDKLMELLREGKSFDDAFTFTFGPPDKYVQAWLGKK